MLDLMKILIQIYLLDDPAQDYSVESKDGVVVDLD